ncbi:Xaa-Pro dipeptidyl-peptidase [Nonomuraea sp. NPDC050310]|uniref:Xaa-Pro dipeptidyl-peptidase n=1 Tax=unclassified Nonomuraea TaxID=2593643 RepID=UPI00340ACBF3
MPQLRPALAAVVLTLTITTPAQASATTPAVTVADGRTQPVFSYADAVREHVYVQAPIDSDADGALDRVRVDIIRPKESGPGLKVPVIIDESPYYDNSGRGPERERKEYDAAGNPVKFPLFYDNYFVPRGYAVLNVDMLGTTKSDGCPDTGGRADVLGGKAVIDWLNGRAPGFRADGTPVAADWTTGKAAMIGKSYDGTLANAVAATGVRGLETIVPISAISSWYEYQRSNGMLYNSLNYAGWLANAVDTDGAVKCAAVRDRMNAEDADETGNYTPFWALRDHRADLSKMRASVFAVHTVNDLNVKPDTWSEWWDALAQRGIPRKVWVGQYEHVDPFDFEGRRDIWVDTLHRWFDYWLHGVRNGILREPRADVQLAPGRWITQRDWPAPNALPVALRPSADGSLGLLPARPGATGSFTDLRLSETAMVADVGTPAPGRLAYTTGPLPLDLRLSGTPVVDLRVTLDKPAANLTALLVDFGETPRVDWRTGQGIVQQATESCHGDASALDDGCYKTFGTAVATRPLEIVARGWIDTSNRDSLSVSTPVTPGTSVRVRWETLPQEYVFRKGNRIGLVLAGTDNTYTRAENPTGTLVTVDLARSKIVVPLVLTAPPTENDLPAAARSTWTGPAELTLPEPQSEFY